MLGDVGEDGREGSDAERSARRNGDPVLPAHRGGQAKVATRLAHHLVVELAAQEGRELTSGDVARQPHTARSSSRTRWRRTTFGRSFSSTCRTTRRGPSPGASRGRRPPRIDSPTELMSDMSETGFVRESGSPPGARSTPKRAGISRFNYRARRVLTLTQHEARLLRHRFVGTEHLLLGLVHEAEGIVAQVLVSLGISLETAREKVTETDDRPGRRHSERITAVHSPLEEGSRARPTEVTCACPRPSRHRAPAAQPRASGWRHRVPGAREHGRALR